MAEGKILLEIVSPYGSVVSEEVDEVVAPGSDGEFGVLPEHTQFLTTLKIGMITYRKGGSARYVFVNRGYAEVSTDRVMILADSAERSEEIDVERAKAAMKRAEERLKKAEETDFTRAESALERAVTRIQLAELKRVK